ncbi:hypothetical protein ABTO78_20730, partial [Acinetobacter baumannii]
MSEHIHHVTDASFEAEVIKAEKHPKADKLLVLTLNVGDHTRQVVSGIAQFYTPQSLVGKKL